MKKPLNTPIDQDVMVKFKAKCKEKNLNMNTVLEKFMLAVVEGNVLIENEIKLKNNRNEEN